MKSFLLFLISGLVLTLTPLNGQMVKEQSNTMSLGSKYSYYVEINGANSKLVENEWKNYMKSYGKLKYNKKANEYFVNGAKIAIINGTNTMDVYARIEEGKDQVTVYTWYDLGGAFANPTDHSSQTAGIRTFMSDFWISTKKVAVNQELAEQEKKKVNLGKELERLEKTNTSLHDDIAKLKERIKQNELQIEQNLRDQDDKRVEIRSQEKVIAQVVDKLNNIGKEPFNN